MKTVYLDNNATTAVDPQVVDAMLPVLRDHYGNPSSMYAIARTAAFHLKEARTRVATLIGADPGEIVFTSCGTESDGAAIWSALRTRPGRRHLVTTAVEHSAVKNLCEHLAENGHRLTVVPVDEKGRLDMALLRDSVDDDTALVSVMWANNETGVLFPVEEIARICRDRGALFHTDAVQAVGKIPIDLSGSAIDMLSLSGHKLHAPKGIGALYIRKGTPFSPFLRGGHQEGGRRAGTENMASIVALGRAAQLAAERMDDENTRVRDLRDRLENGLLERVPRSRVNGDRKARLPNTTNISFDFVEGESILLLLDAAGICASSGSACTTGSLEPSHVLRAMDVPREAAHGSIRLSLGFHNTAEEIDYALETIPPIVARLRDMSPFWKETGTA
jgi:cysteine desulfurase